MKFWTNPETAPVKAILFVAAIAIAGFFVFTYLHTNPLAGKGTVIDTTTSVLPTVSTTPAYVKQTSATLMGTVSSVGSATVADLSFEYGVYSATPSYTSSVSAYSTATAPLTSPLNFSHTITGLACGTTYQFRAKATNTVGAANGGGMTFTTWACTTSVTFPTVSTGPVTSITPIGVTPDGKPTGLTGATLNGNLTGLGGTTSVSVRFEYGRANVYGVYPTSVAMGTMSTTGTFSVVAPYLVCGTPYFARAIAENLAGWNPGGDVLFTSSPCATMSDPVVSTSAPASITQTGATLGGNITSLGGTTSATVSFEYGTTTAYGSTLAAGSKTAVGAFTANLTTLPCNTTYHYRAKAVTSASSSVGWDTTFTTLACTTTVAPTISTTAATSITQTSATLNGNLTSLGGATSITATFDYGTTTAYGSTLTAGTKTAAGAFTASLTALTCNTTYHVRAKAVNTAGTSTGTDTTFTTAACTTTAAPATVATVSALAGSTTYLTGSVTSLGSWTAPLTAGFQYGTTTAYGSTTTPQTSSGGNFRIAVTGLMPHTMYHYRAFVKNSAGVMGYGSDKTFLVP